MLVQGFFDIPISEAARRLGVGVTTLKKVRGGRAAAAPQAAVPSPHATPPWRPLQICRTSRMGRWPYRKRSSLRRLEGSLQNFVAKCSPGAPHTFALLPAVAWQAVRLAGRVGAAQRLPLVLALQACPALPCPALRCHRQA